jgi:hypothetical protein
MTTLADLTADIADDLDDTTGEYGAAILKAVQGAQRDCERSTYYFNETRDVTFATVVGQDWYGAAANANIPTLVHIHAAYIIPASNQISILHRRTPEELELLLGSNTTNSQPTLWTYFGQRIRLYPMPDLATYTVRLQLGPYRLIPLVSPGDNNAWLDEAYDLIKARAKYRIYKNTIKDANLAAEALNDYNDQESALTGETTSRHSTGYIRPTRF